MFHGAFLMDKYTLTKEVMCESFVKIIKARKPFLTFKRFQWYDYKQNII